MIKSYQGERKKKEKELSVKSVKVEDCMTKQLVTFRPDQLIHEVIEILLEHNISGGPVVNENKEVVGIISEGDCMKEVRKGIYDNMPTLSDKVAEFMTTNVISILPETNVFEVADLFLEKKIRRFPVIKDGQLLGQISQRDVMKAVMKMKSATW
tara:strand:+ start:514 stop:975 length:462 start_codon:yes stop_codon:yes gene_type:complete